MKEIVKLSMLLEIYKDLITEKQREVLNLYYNEDLSLSEIAESFNISRQAVRDNIKNGERNLLNFEEKIGMLKIKEMIFKLGEKINLYDSDEIKFEDIKNTYKDLRKIMEE